MSRPANAAAWPMVQRMLSIDDKMSARLVLALTNARSSKAPPPAPPPREQLDAATLNRLEKGAKATVGEQASISRSSLFLAAELAKGVN